MVAALTFVAVQAAIFSADSPIFLVTPAGVFRSQPVDGVPGAWEQIDATVVVQGFGDDVNPGPGPSPTPPLPTDPIVHQVVQLAKANSLTESECFSVAAFLDMFRQSGTSGDKLREALSESASLVDTSLAADGRVTSFLNAVCDITTDPAKITAGLNSVHGTPASIATHLADSALGKSAPDAIRSLAIPERLAAFDFTIIIKFLQMIFTFLQSIGKI